MTERQEITIGEHESQIVQSYLRVLSRSAKRGARTSDDIIAELQDVHAQLETAIELNRLALLQRRENLELEAYELGPDKEDLETQFVAIANAYGAAKGISYSTWREIGVPKETLERAGVPRTRRKVPKAWLPPLDE